MLVGQRRTGDADVRPLKRNVAWRAADRACAAVLDRLDLQYLLYPSSFGVALDPWFRESQRRAALQRARQLLQPQRAASALAPAPARLAALGHVGADRPRRVLVRMRALAARLRLVPVPRRVPAARARHDRGAVPVEGRRLPTLADHRRRAVALARADRAGEPAARAFPGAADPERARPRDFPAAASRGGASDARAHPERPVVLFSSLERNDRRKGGNVLAEALSSLRNLEFQLAVLGPEASGFGRDVAALGTVHEDERLALAYAAADVFVLPALAENLPNVAVESIACGTPVVAFDRRRHPRRRPRRRDRAARPARRRGSARGAIRRCSATTSCRARLAAQARAVAEAEFAAEREARDFAALYEELIAA